jgi:hypothetical protein
VRANSIFAGAKIWSFNQMGVMVGLWVMVNINEIVRLAGV